MNSLKQFEALLLEYNKNVNLISRKETDIWNRHIMNSLLLEPYLKKDEVIMDIGTGAGFPGMVLALSGYSNIILVESKKKKCDFLQHVKNVFNLNVNIINQDVNVLNNKVDVVVSRALASIDKLLSMTKNLHFKKMILLKGDKLTLEILEAKKNHKFEYQIYPNNIIIIHNIRH